MKFKTDLVILRRYYTHFCLTELSYRDKCGLFAFYLDHIYSPSLFIVKTRSVGHILYMTIISLKDGRVGILGPAH